ncbi:host-nuclease inhibitor Gam family protein [Klebsiella pneumoniae]
MKKNLPQHLFKSLYINHLQHHKTNKKSITHTFNNNIKFQKQK